MDETVYVDCPHCNARLEVDRKTGKVVKSWEKVEKKEGTDFFAESLKKQKEEKARLNKYFTAAPDSLKQKKKELQDKFEAEKKRIHDEGDTERPINPMDLD